MPNYDLKIVSPEVSARVRELLNVLPENEVVSVLGVSRFSVVRAVAALPMHKTTVAKIEQGLAKLTHPTESSSP